MIPLPLVQGCSLQNHHSLLISSCRLARNRPAWAPSICVWWNWKEMGNSYLSLFFTVPPPNEERVVEDAAVHAYGSIYLCINNGRCANHHTIIGQIQILTLCRCLSSALQILSIEPLQVLCKKDVAGTDSSLLVFHNRIDCKRIVLHQGVSNRKQIELLDG